MMSSHIDRASSVSRKRLECQSLLEYASKNRKDGFFNDVTIKVANECFPANRMVLSCFSRVFERMFKVEMKERYEKTVEVKHVDEKSMKILIDYIYSGNIDINNENVMALLASADYLQLEDVKSFCFEFLVSVLSSETWYAIFTAANLYQNDLLKFNLYQHASTNLDKIFHSDNDDFKELSQNEMKIIINNLDRNLAKETSIYQAIVAWTKRNISNETAKFADLFDLLLLDQIPAEFFENVVSKEKLIIEDVQCLKTVMNTFIKTRKHAGENSAESRIVCVGGANLRENCSQVFQAFKQNSYSNLPVSIEGAVARKLNTFAFCIGGRQNDVISGSVWKLDFTEKNQEWQEVASLNQGRCDAGGAVMHGKLIVAGGIASNGEYLSSVELYHKERNAWENICPMNETRFAPALVCGNNCVYAAGGWKGETMSSVECLSDLKGEWKDIQPMQKPRRFHALVYCNEKLYAIGGKSGVMDASRLKSVEMYDPSLGKWFFVSSMSTERSELAACVIGNRIYAVGGRAADGTVLKTIECYDPSEDSWSIVGETSVPLRLHSVLTI